MSEDGRSRGHFLGVAAQLERAGDDLAGQTLGVAAHAHSAEASQGRGSGRANDSGHQTAPRLAASQVEGGVRRLEETRSMSSATSPVSAGT